MEIDELTTRISRKLGRAESELGSANDDVALLFLQLSLGQVADAPEQPGKAWQERAVEFAKLYAERGADRLEIVYGPGGKAEIRIDGIVHASSTRSLALTLEAIAERGRSTGGWVTPEEIIDYAGRRSRSRPTRRAIIMRISRLRDQLVNPWLVQTHPETGDYKFAMRREGQLFVSESID